VTKIQESISSKVWDLKYRYRLQDKILDRNIEDTWQRVAKAVAKAEPLKERAHWQKQFHSILQNFRFLPGGRILAGAGTKHNVTLFNCFVMNIAEDSLRGIFDGLEEGALTLQQGGGVGYDFSVLRPRGQYVKTAGTVASGPVSFMRIWDTTSAILLSTGARRGAMMGVLRCDHPDIEEFVTAKENPQELRHFNVSVMVSDAFMQAVKDNAEWPLIFPLSKEEIKKESLHEKNIIYRTWSNQREPVPCRIIKTIRARDLWQKIIKSAYDYAEPGVLFEDTINRLNNLWYCERISATNPCGEIPLPPYGACNLGSINLTQFVEHAYTPQAKINWSELEKVTAIGTRFLDDVIDISHYPLRAQKIEAQQTRRIGLGLTGLGDIFIMMHIRYGSPESIHLAQRIMQTIAETTWQTSIALAKEKGSFPLFSPEYARGEFIQKFSATIRVEAAQHGMRNSHHNTIAPAGTISLLANNISNGIEPVFRPEYERYVRSPDDERLTFQVRDYALQVWRDLKKSEDKPPAWADVSSLLPEDHLNIQAAVQPYIDNAISKTINIPENFPFEKLEQVYTKAHALGLKGCTVFRPNPVTGSVLVENTEVDKCHVCGE